MKVSIIIPVFNEERNLLSLFQSLSIQTNQNFEIIMINDASVDKSLKYMEQYKKMNPNRVIIINNNTQQGQAVGKNQGISKSTGEYLLFLDGDSYLNNKDIIENLIEYYESDPNIMALVASLVPRKNSNTFVKCIWLLDQLTSKKRNGNYYSLPGSGMSFRKSILETVSHFDTRAIFSEDADLDIRIKKYIIQNNYIIMKLPNYEICTDYPDAIVGEIRRRWNWGLGKGYLIKKYGVINRRKDFGISTYYHVLIILSILLFISPINVFISVLLITIILLPFINILINYIHYRNNEFYPNYYIIILAMHIYLRLFIYSISSSLFLIRYFRAKL